MSNMQYPIVVKPLSEEDGGGFVAFAPDLYGCKSDGDTPEEALANVRDAIEEWVDEMRRLGREVPEPGSAEHNGRMLLGSMMEVLRKQHELLGESADLIDQLARDYATLSLRIEQLKEEAEQRGHWIAVPMGIALAEFRMLERPH